MTETKLVTADKEKVAEKLAQVGANKELVSKLDPAVLAIFNNLAESMMAIRGDLSQVKGTVEKFKEKEKAEIEKNRNAGPVAEGTPPLVVAAVHEILGEEFGVEVEPSLDKPAYTLHIIVPPRFAESKTTASKEEIKWKAELEAQLMSRELSKKERSERYEELMAINNKIAPVDKRSCVISFAEGIPKVKEWALKVKAKVAMAMVNQGPKV